MLMPSSNTGTPAGQITRGKTAPNRLRGVDRFLAGYDPELLTRCTGEFSDAPYVDLGYGAEPTTTLESAARLRRLNPDLQVIGVEIDPERVARGRPFIDDRTDFRLGGFNLPLTGTRARLVRAFNVLRQYEEADVVPAIATTMDGILPGGLLMDGTSDPLGRVWTANLIRRDPGPAATAWHLEALVLGANLRLTFEAEAFQTRLPKSFIHRMVDGDPVFRFMADWKASVRDTRGTAVWGPRAWFTAAGGALAGRGYDIMRPDKWLRQGWLVWREPGLDLR